MIRPGDRSVRHVYVGGQPARRVYAGTGAGSQVVWDSGRLPVVRITGTSGIVSREQFRQACLDYGTTYDTVEELPFELDTSQATDLNNLFRDCAELVAAPTLDTSSVTGTGLNNLFRGCSSLQVVHPFDTSGVTRLERVFYECESMTAAPALDTTHGPALYQTFLGCSALASVPDLDTANVTEMTGLFQHCSSLTDGNVRLIGKHPSVRTTNMIVGSGLTRLPFYDAAGNPIE